MPRSTPKPTVTRPSWVMPNATWILVMESLGTNLICGGGMSMGPKVPYNLFRKCTVKINDTHVFFGGGGDHNSRGVIMLEVEAWQFTELANMTKPRLINMNWVEVFALHNATPFK